MLGLAQKIRHARRNANFSQKQLGQKLRISEMAISAYETGRALPPLPTLKKISQVTRLPLSYFTNDRNAKIDIAEISVDLRKIKEDVTKILEILTT